VSLWQREEIQKMLRQARSLGGNLHERGKLNSRSLLRGHVPLAANLCVILGSQPHSSAQDMKVSH